MSHPILHLIKSFCEAGASLALLVVLALAADRAERQWPWLVGFAVLFVILTADYGAVSYLQDACNAGYCHAP